MFRSLTCHRHPQTTPAATRWARCLSRGSPQPPLTSQNHRRSRRRPKPVSNQGWQGWDQQLHAVECGCGRGRSRLLGRLVIGGGAAVLTVLCSASSLPACLLQQQRPPPPLGWGHSKEGSGGGNAVAPSLVAHAPPILPHCCPTGALHAARRPATAAGRPSRAT